MAILCFKPILHFIVITSLVLISLGNANTDTLNKLSNYEKKYVNDGNVALSQPRENVVLPSFAEVRASLEDDFTNELQLSPEFRLTWSVNLTAQRITFLTNVRATGWVGLGLSLTGSKAYSDGIVGGLHSGGFTYFEIPTSKFHDVQFSNDGKLPIKDQQCDWWLTSVEERSGNTSMVFWREFDTGDSADIVISDSYIYLIWAFHGRTDEPFELYGKHSQHGSFKINLLVPVGTLGTPPTANTQPLTDEATSTESTTESAPTTASTTELTTIQFTTTTSETNTTTTTTKPPEFDFRKEIEITPDLMVQWFVDLRGQRIQFVLQVRALGWVGFGISDTGKKSHADIILREIKDGSYYFDDAHFNEDGVVPMWDDQVNWKFVDGFEYDGSTVLEFWREFDTGDINDVPIKDKIIDVIWAFHPSLDTPYEISSRHSQTYRGFYRVNLLDPTTLSDSVIMHHQPTAFFPKYTQLQQPKHI